MARFRHRLGPALRSVLRHLLRFRWVGVVQGVLRNDAESTHGITALPLPAGYRRDANDAEPGAIVHIHCVQPRAWPPEDDILASGRSPPDGFVAPARTTRSFRSTL